MQAIQTASNIILIMIIAVDLHLATLFVLMLQVSQTEKIPPTEMTQNARELLVAERLASAAELETVAANRESGRSAMRTAMKFIEQLQLEMKLLNAHYSLDGKLIMIQFTADGRVDFRELVKELSHALSARIELRQIGVRDETSICGGIGICGQELCCSRFRNSSACNAVYSVWI